MKNQNYRIDAAFSTEKGNFKSLPTAFMYEKALYGRYKKVLYDNIPYLVGINPIKYQNGKYAKFADNELYCLDDILEPIYCNNTDLLISLLRLKSKLDKYDCQIDNKLCINAISKWCVKYGLPFDGIRENIKGNQINNDIFSKYNQWGFSIQSFIEQLKELEKVFLAYINLKFPENKNRLNGYSKQAYKFILEDAFDGANGNIKFDTNTNSLIILFSNLFHAALYELAILVSSNYNNSTKDIGICQCCGQAYEKTRRNQKYCENCSPQKAYKRRIAKLNKEKMEAE